MMKNSTLALATEIEIEPAAPPAARRPMRPCSDRGCRSARSRPEADEPARDPAARACRQSTGPASLASWAVRLLSLAAGVLLWHLACAYKLDFFINFDNVPAPLVVLSAFIGHVHDSKFYIHILVSIKRILIGFALATAIGIVSAC